MFRKFSLIIVLAVFLTLLSGCIDMEVFWNIDETGNLKTKLLVYPSSMDDDEFKAYVEALKLSYLPVLPDVEIISKVIKKGYSEKPAYEFVFKNPIKLSDLKKYNIDLQFNGTRFALKIPKYLTDEPYSPDDVVFVIRIKFPREIDIANTADYSGNEAVWKITREMLYTGVELKAYLK